MDHDHIPAAPEAPKTTEASDAAEAHATADTDFDGLAGKPAAELTPEELRLMADTMPGDGPGD